MKSKDLTPIQKIVKRIKYLEWWLGKLERMQFNWASKPRDIAMYKDELRLLRRHRDDLIEYEVKNGQA